MRHSVLLSALTAAFAVTSSSCAGDIDLEGATGVRQQAIVGGRAAGGKEFSGVLWLDSGCSATLIAPSVVIFGAHCGAPIEGFWAGDSLDLEVDFEAETAIVVRSGHETLLPTTRCVWHPEAAIGGGTDIAACVLESPAFESTPLPIVSDLERASVEVGDPVTLVGFGFSDASNELSTLGVRRVVNATISELGSELLAGSADAGTCGGDSGGPALMRGQDGSWRVLGLLSSGESGTCGEGRYTDVLRFLDWIQSEVAAPDEPMLLPESEAASRAAKCEMSRPAFSRHYGPEAILTVGLAIGGTLLRAGRRSPPALGGRPG